MAQNPIQPSPDEQQKLTDESANPEVQPSGQPIPDEVNIHELLHGIDIEEETPEEVRDAEHPTPKHPIGRLEP